jgi:hypothetical protein
MVEELEVVLNARIAGAGRNKASGEDVNVEL